MSKVVNISARAAEALTGRLQERAPRDSGYDHEMLRVLEEAIKANNTDVIDHILGVKRSVRSLTSDDWTVVDGKLNRTFTFPDRRHSASFIISLFGDANVANHHPDIAMDGDAVTVIWCTHSEGDTITDLDRLAADRTDNIAATFRAAGSLETLGGKGSGNFEHEGRPGSRGGSQPAADGDNSGADPEKILTEVLGPKQKRKRLTIDILQLLSEPKMRKLVEAFTIKSKSTDNTTRLSAQATLKSINSAMQQRGMRSAGGPGSGNFGHEGRPGEIGGSASSSNSWKDAGGWEHTGITWKQDVDENGRPIPIKVSSVEEAVVMVLDGKVVEVADAKAAHTLIEKLADMAKDAKAKGESAPEYDLCQVSIPGSSMFCAKSLRTKEYPEGVPRIEMPQLGGKPEPGSEADKLPRNPWDPTEVDGASAFITYLQGIGIKTEKDEMPAANLRASQREIKGQSVAKMMSDKSFDPGRNPVFISSDDYVVDGHHRWAAVVGRDAEDGVLGDKKMNVIRVNAPISEVLHLANAWSKRFGIKQVEGVKKQAEATGLMKKAG